MSRFSDVEVAVVGAGAAGLAAGRTLMEAGRSTLVLEARDRIGGRAWTIPGPLGSGIDLGCEWLHSGDVNPWTELASTFGHAVNRHRPDWSERLARREGAEAQAAYLSARGDFYQQIETFADGRPDCALADLLEPGFRWTGIFDAVNTWITGTELDQTSAREQALYADSGVNWRLARGFGALIAEYGAGLPIALSCPVTAVDSTGAQITLETPQGTVRCDKLILTLPPNLLLSGSIRFTPTLPQSVLTACEGLPLGLADKLFFHLSAPIEGVTANTHLIGRTDSVETAGYEVMPQGRPLVSVYVGGRFARSLEDAGPEAFADFALSELTELFGGDIRSLLTPLASSAWASDPWAGGSYSHALPGRYEDRLTLAQPVDGRIFFAGEASHATDFSTAHGAYKTGLRAAAAALES